jgi:leader peptidase (prepilin peptidase)/N-methyltransferase
MTELDPGHDGPLLGRQALAWAAGLSIAVLAGLWGFVPPLAALFSAYLFFTMALITLTDLRHFIVPDVLSLPAIPVGLLANALIPHGGGWQAGLVDGITGALIGGGVFLGLRLIYSRLRGAEGLGLGDVKLAAVAGAWLGPSPLPSACLAAALAAIAAVLLRRGKHGLHAKLHVPFGSFIAPTIFVFWLGQLLGYVPIW